mgnify:CR=1 FL=1
MKIYMEQTKFWKLLIAAMLPLLTSTFPVIFSYATNVSILQLKSLWGILLLLLAIALFCYLFFLILIKHKPFTSALATFVFLLFFLSYGSIYGRLIALDFIVIQHLNFLPLMIVLGFYASFFTSKLLDELAKKIWIILVSILGILFVMNLIKVVPTEFQKINQRAKSDINEQVTAGQSDSKHYPDIYWLVFDEFSGFDAMRDYFNYPDIDKFKLKLEELGFQVVEDSHSDSIQTLHQIATRLNYKKFSAELREVEYYELISENKVMSELKSRGYTTVVLDEVASGTFAYGGKTPIQADYLLHEELQGNKTTPAVIFNSFGIMVAEKTMLTPIVKYFKLDGEAIENHRDTVYFVADELGRLDFPKPTFIYSHLLLPHVPFLFNENGGYIEYYHQHDWNYYLGQYKFTIKIILRTIETILKEFDLTNPPIIILQSDHGARNLANNESGEGILLNFPGKYRTSILFAVYAPACPDMPLKDGIDPVNTFPLVFNCLFDMDIPLQ